MENKKKALVLLNLIKTIGPESIRKLIDYLGDVSVLLDITYSAVGEIDVLTRAQKDELKKEHYMRLLEQELRILSRHPDIRVITILDDEYPEPLKHIAQAPPVLYIRGDMNTLISSKVNLAVVGTRHPTNYGVVAVNSIVKGLSAFNITIVSGLAIGIDSVAHRAALHAGVKTAAVLGNGILNIYPPENQRLSDEIAEKGALVTEFPLTAKAQRQNFPRRNRIISGISDGIVVPEAAVRSGALITADYALEQGKDIFAVPGNIAAPMCVGPNRLIQQGANLISGPEDIALYYNFIKRPGEAKEQAELVLSKDIEPEEHEILELTKSEALSPDQILARASSSLDASRLQQFLVNMELKGLIKRYPGGRYMGYVL